MLQQKSARPERATETDLSSGSCDQKFLDSRSPHLAALLVLGVSNCVQNRYILLKGQNITGLMCMSGLQGGEDPLDALSLQVIFRKRALYLVALLRKMTCNLRHPMGLRHPVQVVGKLWHSYVERHVTCKRVMSRLKESAIYE